MYRQSEKNLLSSNISSTWAHNMVNFGPLAAEIGSTIPPPLQISTGFASWQRYCTASTSGRQINFAALNRGRELCSAGRPSRWALAHILVSSYFFLLLFYFLAFSQRSEIECLPYFHTWCGLSANLECMSEMCCTWLAENTARKNDAKNRHLGTIPQLCRAISSQLRHVSTIGP